MLWRGDASITAKRFHARYQGELAHTEREFLNSVLSLSTKAKRLKRFAVIGAFAFLSLLLVVSSVALLRIKQAEKTAVSEKHNAEERYKELQLAIVKAEDAEKFREAAERQKQKALEEKSAFEKMSKEELQAEIEKTQLEKLRAEKEKRRAEKERAKAEQARLEAQELYKKEKARREKLEKQKRKISTTLK